MEKNINLKNLSEQEISNLTSQIIKEYNEKEPHYSVYDINAYFLARYILVKFKKSLNE